MRMILVVFLLWPGLAFGWGALPTAVKSDAGGGGSASVTDDFNRADGALGANWTTPINSSTTLAINTNRVISSTFNTRGYAYYSGTTFANDQYAQVDLNTQISGYIGVGCRMDNDANGYDVEVTNTTTATIRKLTNGAASTLGSVLTLADLSGKTIRLSCYGTTIELFVDGASVGTRTDATYSAGYPFIITNSNGLQYSVDNFSGGDL